MITLNFEKISEELKQGMEHLQKANLVQAGDGKIIEAVQGGTGLKVSETEQKILIEYSRPVEFFRGVGYLIEGVQAVEETPTFTTNGYMLDCSRNAVASISAVKKLLRHMALMGLNMLQLYTEDTYEIPQWKYFGYQRGRYTEKELKELDKYAADLGIELMPCIQTLAHLNAAIRWQEFNDITDCDDILLVDEEKTYRLIDDMLKQLSSCFTTRRIHIGMDEAHMLGLGKYLDKHGYQNRSEIMCNHLSKVVEICKKYDLKPMMWSDMFFRLAYGDEYYVKEDKPFPEEITKLLRPDVQLVYWDYYHEEQEHYISMLKRHKKFPNDIIFAGGAWKWGGLMPELKYSEITTRAALAACREFGVKEVFVTGWGDDGAECPAFSILPTLQLYAELDYQSDVDENKLASRFKACTGGILEDFFLLDNPNNTTKTRKHTVNTTKPLLYQDIMLGLLDKHVDKKTFPEHFKNCAKELTAAAKRNGEWEYIFSRTAAICNLLEKKCTIGIEITEAYNQGNKEELNHIATVKLPELQELTETVLIEFERQWNIENKVQGLEVIHIRIGGIKTRLEAAKRRILGYLAGEFEKLEELEEERLGFNGDITKEADINAHCNQYQLIATASRLSW